MAIKYTYSIANDTLNGKMGNTLEQEIRDSNITISLSNITSIDDVLDIFFNIAMGPSEETTLDSIISAHTGENLLETGIVVLDKVDKVSNAITYHGENLNPDASSSDSTWRVSRTLVQGKIITTECADGGRLTKKWDDRESLFTDPEHTNVLSTLFDGVNDTVDFGDNHNFDNATAFSLSFCIKANNFSAQRCLWSKVSADANVFGWALYHDNAGKLFLQARASTQLRSFTFNTVMTAGTWYRITMTYSGNQNINGIRCYIDTDVENTPSSGALTNTLLNNSSSTFGSRNSSFYYSGHMTKATFFDKQLSASEVTTMHNSGTPGDISVLSFISSVINYYKLGDDDILPTATDSIGSVNGTYTNFSTLSTDVFKEDTP